MKRATSYHDDLMKDLKDPREAVAYLNAALEEGDRKGFLLALRNVIEARGSMTSMSQKVKINRVSPYKILSKKGNPELGSLLAIINALGIQLKMAPKSSAPRKAA